MINIASIIGRRAKTYAIKAYPLPKGLEPHTLVTIKDCGSGWCNVIDDNGKEWRNVFIAALEIE
jgi:hypothetical protein